MKKEVKDKTKKTKTSVWTYIKKCAPYFAKEKEAVIVLIILSLIVSIFFFMPVLLPFPHKYRRIYPPAIFHLSDFPTYHRQPFCH